MIKFSSMLVTPFHTTHSFGKLAFFNYSNLSPSAPKAR